MATEMMEQYLAVKRQYEDAILFYRLGDFYEMFYGDAELASRELELTLTGRNCGEEKRAPMCGVPFHAADQYIGKLVAKGYKVAICEQMEDPKSAKGLVKRDIVRVVTPGTVIDNTQLLEETNNFICSLCRREDGWGAAFSDLSTGELYATYFGNEAQISDILSEISAFTPHELLVNQPWEEIEGLSSYVRAHSLYCGRIDEGCFAYEEASQQVLSCLHSLSYEENQLPCPTICAIGALLTYLAGTQRTEIRNIATLRFYLPGQYLEMDMASRRNLELCETMRSREKKGSLLGVLDHTGTAAGARLLRRWIEQPLMHVHTIHSRQKAIGELLDAFIVREELESRLRYMLDLERLITKAVYNTASPRDLLAIASTLSLIPPIRDLMKDFKSDLLSEIRDGVNAMEDLCAHIQSAISEDAPLVMRDGGYIRQGYNQVVDELTHIVKDGDSYIRGLEEEEKQKTGIKNLKISYNRVFGYYIEVSKSNIGDVPERYIRRQTLTNGERYVTEELKEKEVMILGAAGKLSALEYELFTDLRDEVASQAEPIKRTSRLLANLDVLISLARVAAAQSYCCPEVDYSDVISIKEGRHPVVEQCLSGEVFVPNDTLLDTAHNRLMLITGPNMAGKSTYMRQVALITLMAQIGSYVPAKEARIGIVDQIFTRVGASDDLATGQSTFMLEMNEVAGILNHATPRSLILYDEIGRGTSTYDGMSIARAVAEYTAGKKLGAKAMFATHYHELTVLEKEMEGVVNYNAAAKKRGEELFFMRRIIRGAADGSYGIEVAKLAGIPGDVIKRARAILKEITTDAPEPKKTVSAASPVSITFDDQKAAEVRDILIRTDLNLLTPLDAMNLLADLKKKAL